ncbi:unnamed protein product [Haemonchus placei]|uniref:Obg domain-containing protein n=1 Tax=Haemonchus placei TaxID=6290 RepID=A0A0N4W587_HAEPC|nr:unnamed protein product [Haemonchus placei]
MAKQTNPIVRGAEGGRTPAGNGAGKGGADKDTWVRVAGVPGGGIGKLGNDPGLEFVEAIEIGMDLGAYEGGSGYIGGSG